jgi:hypothetical protein
MWCIQRPVSRQAWAVLSSYIIFLVHWANVVCHRAIWALFLVSAFSRSYSGYQLGIQCHNTIPSGKFISTLLSLISQRWVASNMHKSTYNIMIDETLSVHACSQSWRILDLLGCTSMICKLCSYCYI